MKEALSSLTNGVVSKVEIEEQWLSELIQRKKQEID